MRAAVEEYGKLVRGREYPGGDESVALTEDVWAEVAKLEKLRED
jgi:hypothetical protein